jgi:eukaryotic-like serine/threonine-protein kinase
VLKKDGFWTKDWFFALVVVLVMLALSKTTSFFDAIETRAYDLGVVSTSKTPNDKIAIIAIDDQSIANIGRWPWSREVHAKMIDKLGAANAKVIANTVFFFEPQQDPGLRYINDLLAIYNKNTVPAAGTDGVVQTSIALTPPPAATSAELVQFGALLNEAEDVLNADRKLAASIKKAGTVVLPTNFSGSLSSVPPQGKADKPLPAGISGFALNGIKGPEGAVLYGTGFLHPIEPLVAGVASLGSLAARPDNADGAIRTEPLVLDYFGQQFPSYSVAVAAKSLNLTNQDVKATLGEDVRIGKLKIRTDGSTSMRTYFYKDKAGQSPFQTDSFFDVYSGKIPATKYKDKIVLIGSTAQGTGATQVTPVSANTDPVTTLAHSVSSILQEHFFVEPTWGVWVSLLALLLVAAYLIGLLPKLRAGPAAIFTLALLLCLIGAHFALMMGAGLWVQLMFPAVLLFVGHLLLTTKRFLMTERGKEKADADGAESNRMLGLAFQQQGQLDMAFDKFRKCPIDEQLLENVYSLGLDFERRRQFNKAESAFMFIKEADPKFRDVEERTARAKTMSETIILGGSSAARSNAATMVLSGSGEKPMLGRYSIERELGKGAMGVVYLGKDPKIGREVAIKTMALSAEFEGEELEEAKTRFFREAESAGRLDHPNIVKIYDAGEEHDLAFIAMEFLKGKDLAPHTKMPNLLELNRVLSIVERVAEGLGHAHGLNIVHRDIKPANIMYDHDLDVVKITDFGIARVTDSSKTKTGMVLGTPSYMSPEQLAGKKIDGRSDLFSLGVMLYQMTCGRLPFEGESMTQLMFKIANQEHPNILEYNPALPQYVRDLIDMALEKDFDKRVQSGKEFATAIRSFRQTG